MWFVYFFLFSLLSSSLRHIFVPSLILYTGRFLLPQRFSSLLRIIFLLVSYVLVPPLYLPFFLSSLCLSLLPPTYLILLLSLICVSYSSYVFHFSPHRYISIFLSLICSISLRYILLSFLLRVSLCSGLLYAFLSPSRMRFSSLLFYGFLPYFLLLSFYLLRFFFTYFSLYHLILYYRRTDCFQRQSH